MAMKAHYFDDFRIGQEFETGRLDVSEADIIRFADEFDPQYFHNDPARAAASPFGGLIASGFHTISASMKLFFETKMIEESNLSSPGIDEIRWRAPLRPGDTIRQRITVEQMKPSTSKPDRGVLWFRHLTLNQRDEVILEMLVMHMIRRRPTD
jgi:acyl dehydratase